MKRLSLLFMTLGICGCLTHGTTRTDLSKWETFQWPYMGIQIERPVTAPGLCMHHHSSGTLADGAYRIEINVEKFTPEAFGEVGKISPENRLSTSQQYVDWLKWMGTFHAEIAERSLDMGRKEYRRDVKAKDSVVYIHATYVFAEFSPEERAIDEAAIKRILVSAKPMIEEPQPSAPPLPRDPRTGHSEGEH